MYLSNKMTVKHAIKILELHNKWRRGSNKEQQDPKDIGKAIDIAIKFLKYTVEKENLNRYQF